MIAYCKSEWLRQLCCHYVQEKSCRFLCKQLWCTCNPGPSIRLSTQPSGSVGNFRGQKNDYFIIISLRPRLICTVPQSPASTCDCEPSWQHDAEKHAAAIWSKKTVKYIYKATPLRVYRTYADPFYTKCKSCVPAQQTRHLMCLHSRKGEKTRDKGCEAFQQVIEIINGSIPLLTSRLVSYS